MPKNSTIDVMPPRARPLAAGCAPRASILLVEDNATLRDTLAQALARAGHHVHAAASPSEALDCWQDHADDVGLLIVDCTLGYASGGTLASKLRTQRTDLCVLYVSGSLERLPAADVLGPREACLAKPFGRGELLRAVDHLLLSSN